MYSSIGTCLSLTMLVILASAATLMGCRQQAQDIGERGGFAMRDASDCLPDITLIDQHGRKVSLASLKGKPVLFDFIYTTCPGPCLLLTQRMKRIAGQLGPRLGTVARIVSTTVDPEHDQQKQLLAYANEWHADVNGWLFLTGTPKQIDDVMARFKLFRQREADGTVDHVLEFFLVDANGHATTPIHGRQGRTAASRKRHGAGGGGRVVKGWRAGKRRGCPLGGARMKSSRASVASLLIFACVSAAAILVVRINAPRVTGSALTVRAVAHQWWWEFDYPSLGIKTSNVLYVPSATHVRLELVSADVLHSFWIAGMKDSVNIVPGKTHPLNLVDQVAGGTLWELRFGLWLWNRLHAVSLTGERPARLRAMGGARAVSSRGVQATAQGRRAGLRPEYRLRVSHDPQFSRQAFATVA